MKSSPCHLALLRGINVGGKNRLPMADLTQVFCDVGCRDVRTFIQSGNVLFRAEKELLPLLATSVSQQIAERFGLRVPIVMRTTGGLTKAIRDNPFLQAGVDQEKLHMMFLADTPLESDVLKLDSDRSAPDAFAVRGQEIYLHMPNGMGTTKLTNAYFDSKLKTVSTVRNWRTVLKLAELMCE